MIDWFRQRAPREQLVLVLGTVLAAVIIGWNFVWTPLRDGASELGDSVTERSRQVIDLRRAADLGSAATAPADGTRAARSPLALIDETARPLGLSSAITRSTPEGNDVITVSFRDARFDRLIGWLIDLEQTHGFAVVSASFTGTQSTGLVSGQVRLDRS